MTTKKNKVISSISLGPNVGGLECENAFDDDLNTHWFPASSWQAKDYDEKGKLTYADHDTAQFKKEQPTYTMIFGQYIGLKQLVLRQFDIGMGFTSKIR